MYPFYLSIDVILCLIVCNLFSVGFPCQVVLYPPAFKDEIRIDLISKVLIKGLYIMKDPKIPK